MGSHVVVGHYCRCVIIVQLVICWHYDFTYAVSIAALTGYHISAKWFNAWMLNFNTIFLALFIHPIMFEKKLRERERLNQIRQRICIWLREAFTTQSRLGNFDTLNLNQIFIWSWILLTEVKWRNVKVLKKLKGPTPASLCLFLVFSKNNTFLQQINVKKCPSSIWCQDLNPRPLENELSPITTRSGLIPLYLKFWHRIDVRSNYFNFNLAIALILFQDVPNCDRLIESDCDDHCAMHLNLNTFFPIWRHQKLLPHLDWRFDLVVKK